MDKYELGIKVEQIKKLSRQKDYAAAADIADTIEAYRVKDNKILALFADVYEGSGRYEQAKEMLIEAYERTSLGRQLAYRLVKLCVKSGNISEAEEFYEDFVRVSPRDNSKYILQYELAVAKGAPIDARIEIMETYLSDEMDEKWAFELAKLYHKAGLKDKCVRQCDDVILWFNDGKYVDKALELKMRYAPLTKRQQAKYEERWMAKAPANINVEDIKIKEYDVNNKYNTTNIQHAIKESMDVIMNEGRNLFHSKEAKAEKTKTVVTDDFVNDLLAHTQRIDNITKEKKAKEETKVLNDYEEETFDDQITGQMTIEEILTAYEEREMRIAEEEKKAAEEELKKDATEQFNDNMEFIAAMAMDAMKDEEETPAEVETEDDLEFLDEEALEEEIMEEEPESENEEAVEDEFYEDDVYEESGEYFDEMIKENIEEPSEELDLTEEPLEEQELEKEEEKALEEPAKEEELDGEKVKGMIKDFVSKYSGMKGLDRQLLKVLHETIVEKNTYIFIVGEMKSGRTSLGIDLIKIINRIRQTRGRKIAKISGDVLARKNITEYFEQTEKMDIIVEKVGAISEEKVKEIVAALKNMSDEDKIVVFEDERANTDNFLAMDKELTELFKSQINVKQNKVRDWAKYGQQYAEDKGYAIDEMGMLALHAKIDDLYAISTVINNIQVETLVDDAIGKAKSRGIGRILKIFGKERGKVLREEDF